MHRHAPPFTPNRLVIAVALVLSASSCWAELLDLGRLSGTLQSAAQDVSANGSVVVGQSYGSATKAFMWTDSGVMVDLGTLPGHNIAEAYGVSGDGTVAVGYSADSANMGQTQRAFRWTSLGMQDLGTLGGSTSHADDVSGDGNVVVGYSGTGLATHAFRWTSSGMQDLGSLKINGNSWAHATNQDGSVVVGSTDLSSGGQKAFRWTSAGMVDLGSLPGGNSSNATGVSDDGSVVVGDSFVTGGFQHAFRWTSSLGMVDLGTLGGWSSYNAAVSGDGNVVVGTSFVTGNGSTQAFRWTDGTGMQSVETWLSNNGVATAEGLTADALGTNVDGSVVVGKLRNGDAFIARVTGSGGSGSNTGGGNTGGGGSGLISVQQIYQTLMQAAQNAGLTLKQAGVILHGAHSRPLARRVGSGENAFWIAGDLGQDKHNDRDGNLGFAELGLGRNFGSLQINATLGRTWSAFDQSLNSEIRQDGTYLYAEGLVPLSSAKDSGLWAILSGYHHWGSADIRRGYLNAMLPDRSTGSPDSRTWAISAGLEWDRLLRSEDFSASPYVNFTYTDSSLDAYTETGGGFPASFKSQEESSTEMRLGLNAEKALSSSTSLVGSIEGDYRFDGVGASTTATVLGPGGFMVNIPGQNYKHSWLRAGVGVEGGMEGGKVSLMLNATTEGEMPSYWLAVAWRTRF